MTKIDYHLHTALCKHAVGTVEEYVEAALAAGFDEIGFADHNPLPDNFDIEHRMEASQDSEYLEMVARVQQKYSDITIKLGLEVDYLPGGEDFLREQIAGYPLDYVYGSVHYLGDWNFDNPVFVHRWENSNVDDIYQWYFKCLEDLIASRLFDIIAHPDLVKKFGHRPEKLDLEACYRRICTGLREADMCIEINTSGLRKEVGEIYPARRFLEIAFETGVPIVIGSDAHSPEEVGSAFDKGRELAQAVGYTHIQQFTRRKRKPVPM